MIELLLHIPDFNKTFSELSTDHTKLVSDFLHQIADINVIKRRKKLICDLISYSCDRLYERYNVIIENPNKRTKQTYIARYGDAVGSSKWEEYTNKQRVKNLFETKHKKYGWTPEQFMHFNRSRAVTRDLCIKRHGIENGILLWDRYVATQAYTNSQDYFNSKYGDQGQEKWKECNYQKGKSARARYKVGTPPPKFNKSSKIEAAFIDEIINQVPGLSYIKQYYIWGSNRIYFYDLCVGGSNILEFNGDYWHCNPLKYGPDYFHKHAKMTASEIWSRDSQKQQVAENAGFNVLVIWEHDYRKNKNETIEKTVQWLKQHV